jgi:hypothetical protein
MYAQAVSNAAVEANFAGVSNSSPSGRWQITGFRSAGQLFGRAFEGVYVCAAAAAANVTFRRTGAPVRVCDPKSGPALFRKSYLRAKYQSFYGEIAIDQCIECIRDDKSWCSSVGANLHKGSFNAYLHTRRDPQCAYDRCARLHCYCHDSSREHSNGLSRYQKVQVTNLPTRQSRAAATASRASDLTHRPNPRPRERPGNTIA